MKVLSIMAVVVLFSSFSLARESRGENRFLVSEECPCKKKKPPLVSPPPPPPSALFK